MKKFSKHITSKWWFYLLLLLITFFIPPYTKISFPPKEISNIIAEALSSPLSSSISILFPVVKIILLLIILIPFLKGKKCSRIVAAYGFLSMFLIGVFQSIAITEKYGFVWVIGNTLIICIVGVFWLSEFIKPENNFLKNNLNKKRLWIIPLMLIPLLFPASFTATGKMIIDFSFKNMLMNESSTTYCMVTPLLLGLLILYFPNVNIPLFRVSSFVGLIFGVLNMLMWFVFVPSLWLMGVFHIPLLVLSLYGCLLNIQNVNRKISKL